MPSCKYQFAAFLVLCVDFTSAYLSRDIRATATRSGSEVTQLLTDEKQYILDKHNDYRRQVGANNMRQLIWNDDLAQMAQAYINNCHAVHNTDTTNRFGFQHVGENLFVGSSSSFDLDVIINSWYDEVNSYTYETHSCTGVCGHYTQMVWDESHALGCGIRWCSTLTGTVYPSGILMACNYGPAGNVGNRKPYNKTGAVCSGCPSEAQYCVEQLCSSTSASSESGNTDSKNQSSKKLQSSIFMLLAMLMYSCMVYNY